MDKTRFVTFTGKASLVLQRKGLPATTIHKLIYNAHKNYKTGRFYFTLKSELEDDIDLIVIDEVSMVPMKLLQDLMSFNIPIVALGDPGQLEPIGEDNGLLKKPDIFLEEIHRQAEDNSIIRLSMMAREGKPIPYIADDPNIKVIQREEVSMGMLVWADQILCAKNATRRQINAEMREHLGFKGDLPNKGDKVICLRNYWDTLNDDGYPLINGTIGNVTNIITGQDYGILGQRTLIDFQSDYSNPNYYGVEVDSNIFKGNAPMSQTLRTKRLICEFDFGYAITCHKSQGSEFEKVLIYEEYLKANTHARWLYTSITRASSKLILVKAP
jgi:exodeoxyribonuclease-5